MLRIIAGIIVGVVVTFALVMATFGITIAALGGLEHALKPNSWWTTETFNIIIVIGGFVAAIIGGLACAFVARDFKAAFALAAIILAIRVGNLVMNMNRPDPPPRTARAADAGAPTLEDMFDHGKEPTWFALSMTLTGATGVLIGGALVKKLPLGSAR